MRKIEREIVGAVIVSSDDFILLGEAGTYLGQLCIPGGGLKEGESAEQAVIREVSEETGLVFSEFDLVSLDDPNNPRFETRPKVLRETGEKVEVKMHFIDFFVRLNSASVNIELTELDDFKSPQWYKITEMGILPIASSVLELLKIIKELGHLKK